MSGKSQNRETQLIRHEFIGFLLIPKDKLPALLLLRLLILLFMKQQLSLNDAISA